MINWKQLIFKHDSSAASICNRQNNLYNYRELCEFDLMWRDFSINIPRNISKKLDI